MGNGTPVLGEGRRGDGARRLSIRRQSSVAPPPPPDVLDEGDAAPPSEPAAPPVDALPHPRAPPWVPERHRGAVALASNLSFAPFACLAIVGRGLGGGTGTGTGTGTRPGRGVIAFLAILGAMMAVVVALKAFSRELRPDGSDTMSFPSGHAALACFLAAAVQPHLATLAWAWAAAVCASRVLLRRHRVKDVAVGAAIGMMFAGFEY